MLAIEVAEAARASVARLTLRQRCGQLLIVGFEGTELTGSLRLALRERLRGGVILFRRNLVDLLSTWRLCRDINDTFPADLAAFIGIDEEGGRVTRLPPPYVPLPAMRYLGNAGDEDLAYRAGVVVAQQLRSLGITCNFAPVLDVDSNPLNPVIGDRSFAASPAKVAALGIAFARGMQDQGIAACGKHFPGHGDTVIDSHLELPTVAHDLPRLTEVELAPFRAASVAGLASLMTAHIVFPQLDPTNTPATMSRPILQDVLRTQLGYRGVVVSDDLEMRAIRNGWSVPEAACRAVAAGCDALLICRSETEAAAALDALADAAAVDAGMAAKVTEAATRFLELRHLYRSRPVASEPALLQLLNEPSIATDVVNEIGSRGNMPVPLP